MDCEWKTEINNSINLKYDLFYYHILNIYLVDNYENDKLDGIKTDNKWFVQLYTTD